MPTIHIQNVDKKLYDALLKKANDENRTVNEQIVTMLHEAFKRSEKSSQKSTEDFFLLCSKWKDNRTAEEIIDDIRNTRRSNQRNMKTQNVFD